MPAPLRVLVVDDDRICRQTTAQQLREAGSSAVAAASPQAALEVLQDQPFDVILSDLRMPGMNGLAFLRRARALSPDIDTIVVTAFGTVESAVTAMREGATDYLTKPFPFPELELRLDRIRHARGNRQELTRLRSILDDSPLGGIVGRSEAMKRVHDLIHVFASHTSPTLVTGETGTGKELVARALHMQSARHAGPFVPIGCGAVPHDLAESLFFGHDRGAFTGASQTRRGAFEQADGGTLLLDDIDDLPLDLQPKLLRALQEGTITHVGATKEVRVDVRIVATTKVDLQALVAEGRFRSDLYYRLRGMEIWLPGLRQRGDDVTLLALHFLRLIATADHRSPATLSDETRAALRSYRWPGNVRELRRTMEASDALAHGGTILPTHLPSNLSDHNADGAFFNLDLEGVEAVDMNAMVRRFEDELIAWAMRRSGGQQTRAAHALGVPRTTLQSKLGREQETGCTTPGAS